MSEDMQEVGQLSTIFGGGTRNCPEIELDLLDLEQLPDFCWSKTTVPLVDGTPPMPHYSPPCRCPPISPTSYKKHVTNDASKAGVKFELKRTGFCCNWGLQPKIEFEQYCRCPDIRDTRLEPIHDATPSQPVIKVDVDPNGDCCAPVIKPYVDISPVLSWVGTACNCLILGDPPYEYNPDNQDMPFVQPTLEFKKEDPDKEKWSVDDPNCPECKYRFIFKNLTAQYCWTPGVYKSESWFFSEEEYTDGTMIIRTRKTSTSSSGGGGSGNTPWTTLSTKQPADSDVGANPGSSSQNVVGAEAIGYYDTPDNSGSSSSGVGYFNDPLNNSGNDEDEEIREITFPEKGAFPIALEIVNRVVNERHCDFNLRLNNPQMKVVVYPWYCCCGDNEECCKQYNEHYNLGNHPCCGDCGSSRCTTFFRRPWTDIDDFQKCGHQGGNMVVDHLPLCMKCADQDYPWIPEGAKCFKYEVVFCSKTKSGWTVWKHFTIDILKAMEDALTIEPGGESAEELVLRDLCGCKQRTVEVPKIPFKAYLKCKVDLLGKSWYTLYMHRGYITDPVSQESAYIPSQEYLLNDLDDYGWLEFHRRSGAWFFKHGPEPPVESKWYMIIKLWEFINKPACAGKVTQLLEGDITVPYLEPPYFRPYVECEENAYIVHVQGGYVQVLGQFPVKVEPVTVYIPESAAVWYGWLTFSEGEESIYDVKQDDGEEPPSDEQYVLLWKFIRKENCKGIVIPYFEGPMIKPKMPDFHAVIISCENDEYTIMMLGGRVHIVGKDPVQIKSETIHVEKKYDKYYGWLVFSPGDDEEEGDDEKSARASANQEEEVNGSKDVRFEHGGEDEKPSGDVLLLWEFIWKENCKGYIIQHLEGAVVHTRVRVDFKAFVSCEGGKTRSLYKILAVGGWAQVVGYDAVYIKSESIEVPATAKEYYGWLEWTRESNVWVFKHDKELSSEYNFDMRFILWKFIPKDKCQGKAKQYIEGPIVTQDRVYVDNYAFSARITKWDPETKKYTVLQRGGTAQVACGELAAFDMEELEVGENTWCWLIRNKNTDDWERRTGRKLPKYRKTVLPDSDDDEDELSETDSGSGNTDIVVPLWDLYYRDDGTGFITQHASGSVYMPCTVSVLDLDRPGNNEEDDDDEGDDGND